MDFPQHTQDLAHALRMGDIAKAEDCLDMMARDNERPTAEIIARGRHRADRELGRIAPLPQLDQTDIVMPSQVAA